MSPRRAAALIGLAHLVTVTAASAATYLVGTHIWETKGTPSDDSGPEHTHP